MQSQPTSAHGHTLSDFDFALPPELIAQHPAAERSASRLLDGRQPTLVDRVFRDLPELFQPHDLLVFNDTQVVKARLFGEKPSGGKLELLIERVLTYTSHTSHSADGPAHQVVAHMKVSKKPPVGTVLRMADGAELKARIVVNSAGVYAPGLAASFEGLAARHVPTAFYAKGNYFTLSGKAPFSHLIYPVPEAAGLGVHLTLDLGGQAKFGPDVEWVEHDQDLVVDPARADKFYASIRTYWPALPDGAKREYSSYCGNYTFDGKTLVTTVDASSDPARFATRQVRQVRFEGERMVLVPPVIEVDGVQVHRELTWERISTVSL